MNGSRDVERNPRFDIAEFLTPGFRNFFEMLNFFGEMKIKIFNTILDNAHIS